MRRGNTSTTSQPVGNKAIPPSDTFNSRGVPDKNTGRKLPRKLLASAEQTKGKCL